MIFPWRPKANTTARNATATTSNQNNIITNTTTKEDPLTKESTANATTAMKEEEQPYCKMVEAPNNTSTTPAYSELGSPAVVLKEAGCPAPELNTSGWATQAALVTMVSLLLVGAAVAYRRRCRKHKRKRSLSLSAVAFFPKLHVAASDTDSFTSTETSHGDEDSLEHDHRNEIIRLVEPVSPLRHPEVPPNASITDLECRMERLEFRLAQSQEEAQEQTTKAKAAGTAMETRIEQLEDEVRTNQQESQDKATGQDLMVQKALMDLTCQVEELEEQVEHQQDMTDLTMTLWENRMEFQEADQAKEMADLKKQVETVATDLTRVEKETKRSMAQVQKQQVQQGAVFNLKMYDLDRKVDACHQEWQTTLHRLQQNWDNKLDTVHKEQEKLQQVLAGQLQGLEGDLKSARKQSETAAVTIAKKKFKLWTKNLKKKGKRPAKPLSIQVESAATASDRIECILPSSATF